jgi:hypothetical protein
LSLGFGFQPGCPAAQRSQARLEFGLFDQGSDRVDAPQRFHMRVFGSMVHAWSVPMNSSAVSVET